MPDDFPFKSRSAELKFLAEASLIKARAVLKDITRALAERHFSEPVLANLRIEKRLYEKDIARLEKLLPRLIVRKAREER